MFDARSNTPILGYARPKKVKGVRFTFRPFFMVRQAHHKTLSLSKGFIISLALMFLFSASGGDMLIGEVWAARASSGLTSVGLDSTGSPSPLKSLSAATFTLPYELGFIQESIEVPNSGKTVIHIQDAHCNYAAQKSIAEILNYLTTEYGIYAVNCEGAAENYDLAPFTAIPEKDIREKTADYFVKEGLVSAAEYYAVNNPQKVKLWGVEDPDLYLKNLKIYRNSLTHKDEVDRYIGSIGYILDNLKRHIYSSELIEFDGYYTGYKDGSITFKEYMLYLISMAKKKMVDTKSFSNIYLLSQTLADEDKINFKRANSEKDEVVDKLKKSLSKNELEGLMVMVAKLKAERISQADFYAYLAKKAKSVKLDLSSYSELQKYIIYISLYSAVDRTKVAKEIDALEYRINTSLYENNAQRELGILSKNLAIMKNMFNISLTRDDYIYYKEHEETFAVANYISFIDEKAPLYKITAKLDKNIGMLDEYRDNMDQFYECSLARDKAFIKNIKFTDHDRPNSIIITGGFHTENLRELFKDENVSYVSIMPKFKDPPGYKSPYMKRLAGQKTALENVIDTVIPAVLNLQVAEILSKELADRFYGKLGVELFNYILIPMIAALMRGQSFILKVGKGIPVNDAETEEEKFITFPRGKGADIVGKSIVSASISPNQQANAILAKTASGALNFESVTGQPQAQASRPLSAAEKAAPVFKPFAVITPEGPKLIAPAPASEARVSTAVRSLDRYMGDIIALAKASHPDRVEMVKTMGEIINTLIANDRSNGPAVIRSILSSISSLDRPVRNELIMALRTAVAIKGLGEVRPAGIDVVVQVAPIGQRNSAASANRAIEDKLDRHYNGVIAKSIIGEGIKEDDVSSLASIITQARLAMESSPQPQTARALLLLPAYLQNITSSALDEAGAARDIRRIKIQFVEQGDMPDLVTQFELGIEILEYVRGGEKPEEASQRLLDLITVMVDSDMDPRDILKEFFRQIPIRIRPVNWQTLDEQRKSWEAVAKSL